ncbi:MAG: type II toxin-antitoxin system Phd/YefM family antitoxin [Alphaproteobacteria bacterium]|nr:type II toxin-antitoxin system Phd/YefM family antitoxin [Alphaproteobacteria bacterium]
MKNINITQARSSLFSLVDEANETHKPIHIIGKRSNAVLVSEDDWNAIQETIYLSSLPGVKESILKGRKEPLSKCSKDLKW